MRFWNLKIIFVVLLAGNLALIACNSRQVDVWKNTTELRVVSHFKEECVVLSEEDFDYMVSIWDIAEWEGDITKTVYDYTFFCGNAEIRYTTQYGLFNDIKGNRHFLVSEEERQTINLALEDAFSNEQKSNL